MQTFFFVKEQGRYVRVDFASILYIEARSNYVQIVTASAYSCAWYRCARSKNYYRQKASAAFTALIL